MLFTLSACVKESLECGTYRVSKVYIDGGKIDREHPRWSHFYPRYFIVDGINLTTRATFLPSANAIFEFRIRNGFLERRIDLTDGRQWLRFDGTIAELGFQSTRVENGKIVERFTRTNGEEIQVFFSLISEDYYSKYD